MENNFEKMEGQASFIPKTPEPVPQQAQNPQPSPASYFPPPNQAPPPPQYIPQYGQGQYAPPPQYAQGQYAPPPQYGQGQYAPPPQYGQGQYAPPPQYAQGQYAPPPQYRQAQYAPPPQYRQAQYAPPPQYFNNPYAPQQYAQRPFAPAAPVEVQENGIPVKPRKEERKFIKKFYNRTGGTLLVVLGAMMVLLLTAMLIIESFTDGMGIPELTVEAYITMAMVVIYGVCELGGAAIGSKLTGVNLGKLFTTKTFSLKFMLFSLAFIISYQAIEFFMLVVVESGLNAVDLTMLGTGEEPVTALDTAAMGIYAVFLAPIFEEILFRGFVLKNLSRFNVRFGIIFSSILFGLFHGNLSQFLGATIFGIIVALVTVKSNSLIPAIVMHSVGNGLLQLMSLIALSNEAAGDVILAIWMFAGTPVFVILVIIAWVTKIYKLPNKTPLQANRGAKICLTSVPMIILVIIQTVEVILSVEKL